jgi:PmbA protein
VEKLLDRAKKVAEQAEVFQVVSKTTPMRFEANRLKQVQTKESMGTALRIIRKGRIGFAQASGKINEDDLVSMAVETSQFGAEAKFSFPAGAKYARVQIFDPAIDNISIDNMAQTGQKLIDAVKFHSQDIMCDAYLTKGVAGINIINSNGGEINYNKSFFSLGVEGVIVEGSDMLFVGDGQSSCHPILDSGAISDSVILQLERAKRKVAVRSGALPVIFTAHGVVSALIMPLLSAFNGKTVFNGASPLKDKLGSSVFDARFSLWDDATIAFQVGSHPCDDEGVPSHKTSLIEKGVVSHFMYDLQTAGLANTKSTGNGNRGGGLPSPSANALIIDHGDTSFDDMLKDIDEGLVIEELMGATQGNVLNGDFSGNILLGYKIEKGNIVGRVKNTMASGNIYQVLKQIAGLGNDNRWVDGFLNTPSIYCPALPIASKEG